MEYPHGTIVHSRLPILPKLRLDRIGGQENDKEPRPAVGAASCCDLACSGSTGGRMGVLVCYDGQIVMLNDYPTDGGPWAPAFTAAGSLVWVNVGSL